MILIWKNYKIAAAAAVILCLSTVTVTRVEAFRLPIVRFFMEIKEQSTFFGLQEKKRVALSDKFQRYEPMYIPEGYVVIATEEDKNGFYIGYENEKEKRKYTYSY